jgi:hypothetical protein
MQLLSLILLVLVIWWIAFAICVSSDKLRQPKQQARVPEEQSDTPPDLGQHPHWPTWRECCARPRLFLTVLGAGLIYGTGFVFIWPAFVIHKISLWRHDDHAA